LDEPSRQQWVATQILPHESEVRGWLRRHVRSLGTADIDDLIQEAYSRLWLVDFGGITNGRSYLYTVVRNLLGEQARRARIVPMERLGEIESLRIPTEEPGPERRASARQELERLERIVNALPDQCRRAFQLQKFQGLSQREIASEMGISEKTVEKHLAVALLRVLAELGGDATGAAGGGGTGDSRSGRSTGSVGHDRE
jgi:RNA polymerase sigma-70 factor (ECF subfamily)